MIEIVSNNVLMVWNIALMGLVWYLSKIVENNQKEIIKYKTSTNEGK